MRPGGRDSCSKQGLRAAEVTVSDSLKLPGTSVDRLVS
jgi:hypothetical protein